MTEKEIREKVKDLTIEELGIFSNQLSAYASTIKSVGSELQSMESQNSKRQSPRIFDFNKRGVTLNLKLNEAITYSQILIQELDSRLESKLGLKLDYEYIDGVMEEIYEMKRGA